MIGYGKELILDLHECDVSTFSRKNLKLFCLELCKVIDMEPCKFESWDDEDTPEGEGETEPHLKGWSCVQFIKTSNILIHALELLENMNLNIFSCKDFDTDIATEFTVNWFRGKIVNRVEVTRL